ncbi:hypothetical protein FIU97_15465 [Roseivivax sp. THAF40]|uniref:hypothetical protein n=1 Tax=unclassified Roseivivax TaxID=2639302 RepID=UPI00126968D5|nr:MULTISPECIES: hypothetical protein [unclassified Roseivivax]QFS84151.1 hypothetical protein FIV09_15050 [Roseivivax sp. THAF197b]QFT47979.1 hypothetical protein FIU97_15465 [Roseivivax sp. THAF40]
MTDDLATISSAADFRKLGPAPFNQTIRISQAATWWQGHLYVGGGRGPVNQRGAASDGPADLGAEIMRLDPATGAWQAAYHSPVGPDGVARDRSVRGFAPFQGTSDTAPALYAAVGSMSGQVQILRSEDGSAFADCGPPALGLGDADIAAVRCLFAHEGWLYTTPIGLNKARGWADDNITDLAVVLRTRDPAGGDWQIISPPSFDDPANDSINELCLFGGRLYAATYNRTSGFQLWRSGDLSDEAPAWVKILDKGAWRGMTNPMPTAMKVFDNALYIGTGVQRQPGQGLDAHGPFAPELLRVHPDDSWDLIAGQPRLTAQGLKTPLTGMGPGFDDPFVQAFWRLEVHDGALFVGGSDWRFWPTYLGRPVRPRTDVSPVHLEWLREMTAEWQGHYGMWKTTDGMHFATITTEGLGRSETQFGIRGLISTPHGLVALPAAKRGGSGGGVELWLGGGKKD